ncbi:MAG TPA: hypothetical protein DF774_12940 [Rheinheimera sp.]|uniref:hypothetical protein n=1 Tax=Rheinheimera sp. TaxID=1869214 RepID=UPI000ECCF7CD|nr:hypothetical protein [Rheinheimera sp.]HCU66655.1 hypothetical protein [Rheinheimera sp.]
MSEVQLPFILFNLSLLLFYLLRRNGFDLFGISYFSSFIYFSPTFFGYAGFLVDLTDWVYSPLADKTYAVYFIFLSILFLTTLSHDLFIKTSGNFNYSQIKADDKYKYEMYSAFILLLISFFLLNIFGGGALHQLDKNQVMANIGRWYLLYESILLLAIAYVLTVAKFRTAYICLLFFLCFDVYLGFRTSFVIAILMLFFVSFNKKDKRLIGLWPYLLLGVFAVFSILMLKLMMFGLKKGDIDILLAILSNSQTYEKLLSTSEPFVTQSILNTVVSLDFRTDAEHLKLIPLQFVLLGDVVFGQIRSFNDYFQPALFPKINYGMASNFLAEFYAVSGVFGVFAVSAVYSLVLMVLNLAIQSVKAGYKPLLLLCGVYWAFYIYRNDMAYILNIEKRIVISFLLVILLAFVLRRFNFIFK